MPSNAGQLNVSQRRAPVLAPLGNPADAALHASYLVVVDERESLGPQSPGFICSAQIEAAHKAITIQAYEDPHDRRSESRMLAMIDARCSIGKPSCLGVVDRHGVRQH